jgi:hypothetical protein
VASFSFSSRLIVLVEGGFCLLEVLEVKCCVVLCMLEAVEGEL